MQAMSPSLWVIGGGTVMESPREGNATALRLLLPWKGCQVGLDTSHSRNRMEEEGRVKIRCHVISVVWGYLQGGDQSQRLGFRWFPVGFSG